MAWEAVIGLEVHVQLKTNSKIFSGAATTFGAEPNTQACAVDLGLPGVLPVLNHQAVAMAVKFGLGIEAHINTTSIFARKNYFYPDLPKGYQISQFEIPIVGKGELEITLDDGSVKTIGITRAHLEEDAGKSLHEDFHGMTGIDLNRAGTPLLEIVSEPDLRSAEEAVAYLKSIHALVTYLGICDGNMAQGSMRCDCNVSIRPKGQEAFGTRAEIKNVNSFKFVEKAINYEIERQIMRTESGEEIVQETRLYDADKNETRSMRSKEEANDYRYFPDPDLLPVKVESTLIEQIKADMPELPWAKCQRYQDEYGLSAIDAKNLSGSVEMASFYEALVAEAGDGKICANWMLGELSAYLNKDGITIGESPVSAPMLAGLLKLVVSKAIPGNLGKKVLREMWEGKGNDAQQIIDANGWAPVDDSAAIEKMVDEVLANSPQQIEQYKGGMQKVFGYFVGQVMKASKGKADPAQVNQILRQKLDS
tara:strand:- start:381 stop:1817 length:1437 start_codon:yes stop_codon:yes gene_type:complete